MAKKPRQQAAQRTPLWFLIPYLIDTVQYEWSDREALILTSWFSSVGRTLKNYMHFLEKFYLRSVLGWSTLKPGVDPGF